jgi:hypothetical protein
MLVMLKVIVLLPITLINKTFFLFIISYLKTKSFLSYRQISGSVWQIKYKVALLVAA